MKRILSIVLILVFMINLCACGGTRSKTLEEVLNEDPNTLNVIRRFDVTDKDKSKLICKDFTVYNTGGGLSDDIDATHYAEGLIENDDRFCDYEYIVEDNKTGWKYMFEDYDDIYTWVEWRMWN